MQCNAMQCICNTMKYDFTLVAEHQRFYLVFFTIGHLTDYLTDYLTD